MLGHCRTLAVHRWTPSPTSASGSSVGVLAGHLRAVRPRAPAQRRLHRDRQLRPGRVHGDRRLRDGDPLVDSRHLVLAGAAARRCSLAMAFGLLVGLPSLRLRADYFAIATLASAEVVRIIAQNARGLTGGNQGLFCNSTTSATASTTPGGVSDTIIGWLAGLWAGPIRRRWCRCCSSSGSTVADRDRRPATYATNSPWGRVLRAVREDEDAARALGQEHARLQAPVAGDRGRARRARRLLPRPQPGDFHPDDLRAAGHVLRLRGADPRRPRQLLGRARSARSSCGRCSRARASSTFPISAERRRPLRFVIVGAGADPADGVPPAGAVRQEGGDGAR